MKNQIQIQAHLYIPSYRQAYFMRENGKNSKITKAKWFALHEQGAEVLGPITHQ